MVTGTSPVALSGLTSATAYRAYVRQICPGGGYSLNSAVHNFTTACSSISTFPAIEPFDAVPPACWTRLSGGDIVSGPGTGSSSKWGSDGFLNNGFSGSARANIFSANAVNWLISPYYQLPASGALQVSYDVGATQYGNSTPPTTPWEEDDYIQLVVSTSNTDWTVLKTYDSSNVPSNLGQVDMSLISSFAGQTVRFAFIAAEGALDGNADIDFFIDNFRVGAAPGAPICTTDLMPADAATAVNRNSVLSWGSAANATSYDVYLGITSPPTLVANVSGTSYASSLLAANTMYYW